MSFDKKAYMKEYRKKHRKEMVQYQTKYANKPENAEKIKEYKRNHMKKYREKTGITKHRPPADVNIRKIKSCSYMYVKYHFKEYNGKIHQIHHCYGLEKTSFVILYKQDHKALHKKFGHLNENCLISNKEVSDFIYSVPHLLIKDGEIIENTIM